ncbi:NdvB protein [Colwellia sp. Arc7-635]|uniref:GH36-type glycosyl hydrolase domain-containing protein n=1 Tax=Colwellia sp. Arc7-635 TaxID=2497879 RepID=UPI000F8588D6|nr:NdvB protein [Colwellia sp. Arc7-635]AZQ82639.1 NdvB protein [Colwellia sp. Arc7-635]
MSDSKQSSTGQTPWYQHDEVDNRISCFDPITMKFASGFLWNKTMMIHMNCRGYAVSQFMQPEPSKYSAAPNIEAQTFMQPEQGYFAHHPGRFFYVKCHDTDEVFSLPYEPMRKSLDKFTFSIGLADIVWRIEHLAIEFILTLSLAEEGAHELWQLEVKNLSDDVKNISIYPCFSIGYKSWMNQSADYYSTSNAIIASSVKPYQKLTDYYKNQQLKDGTFLLADTAPTSWTSNQQAFEGEGGVHFPDAIKAKKLAQEAACYETPIAVMQYDVSLAVQQTAGYKFIFGACKDQAEVDDIRKQYFQNTTAFEQRQLGYQRYIDQSQHHFHLECEDKALNQFVNHWLPRQVFYHGDSNRLTTDPQTRNYLQDAIGMCFIAPEKTKQVLLTTLSQQKRNGCLPDGILLHPDAEIKYINLIPHSDHCVWLPICLKVYLDETNDLDILQEKIAFADNSELSTVAEHVELALDYLLNATNDRGLSFIEQGDWCDPLNMVGHKGKGVSSWLSLASAYALQQWCLIKENYTSSQDGKLAEYQYAAQALNDAVNKHLWDGNWYARGITDDNKCFGIADDVQGRIFLNPQSWAMLSGAADKVNIDNLLHEIDQQLLTPFGPMMLAPSYTKMREDVGRLTQKYPGTAENGSVYNHASAFYAFSLFKIGQADKALAIIQQMLSSEKDVLIRQQLPGFIPNYYRGAYQQFPDMAGRSSQLFNTGTVAWVYRCIIEELCGLKGEAGSLIVAPKMPSHWQKMTVKRQFLNAHFIVKIYRDESVTKQLTIIDGKSSSTNKVENIQAGKSYCLDVLLPFLS